MNKKILTAFLICTLSIITACGSKDKSKKTVDSSDFKDYSDSEYTISLPDGWGKTENKNASLSFLYKSSKNDFFTESINIIIQDLETYDYTLDTYKDVSVSNYEELGYEIEECQKTTINDNDFYSIISHSENDGKNIYCKQLFALLNKKAYIFTFAAEESDFKKLSDETDAIFNTIKISRNAEENNTSENAAPSDEQGNTDENAQGNPDENAQGSPDENAPENPDENAPNEESPNDNAAAE